MIYFVNRGGVELKGFGVIFIVGLKKTTKDRTLTLRFVHMWIYFDCLYKANVSLTSQTVKFFILLNSNA